MKPFLLYRYLTLSFYKLKHSITLLLQVSHRAHLCSHVHIDLNAINSRRLILTALICHANLCYSVVLSDEINDALDINLNTQTHVRADPNPLESDLEIKQTVETQLDGNDPFVLTPHKNSQDKTLYEGDKGVTNPAPDQTIDQKKYTEKEMLNSKAMAAVDRSQKNVSERLHRFSSYVDQLFADESYVQESQDSRMRLSLTTRFRKHEDPTFQPRINLSLSLPNTKNRVRLRFQSNDQDLGSNEETNIDSDLSESIANTTFSSALGLIVLANKTIDIRADAGIRFSSTIDPFSRLRLRKSFLLDKIELRLTETFQWRDSRGRTAQSLFEIEYPFTQKYLFRSRSEALYADEESFWSQAQSLTLFRKLSEESIIAYSIGVSGQDEDTLHLRKKDQVNDYWIELRYRKTFYKNWLSYQVTPGLNHPREYEFDPSPRIELRLEALYGDLVK